MSDTLFSNGRVTITTKSIKTAEGEIIPLDEVRRIAIVSMRPKFSDYWGLICLCALAVFLVFIFFAPTNTPSYKEVPPGIQALKFGALILAVFLGKKSYDVAQSFFTRKDLYFLKLHSAGGREVTIGDYNRSKLMALKQRIESIVG